MILFFPMTLLFFFRGHDAGGAPDPFTLYGWLEAAFFGRMHAFVKGKLQANVGNRLHANADNED